MLLVLLLLLVKLMCVGCDTKKETKRKRVKRDQQLVSLLNAEAHYDKGAVVSQLVSHSGFRKSTERERERESLHAERIMYL